MVTTLPVPIEFELPPGWTPAPPDEAGAPGVAFVAVRALAERTGFTPNITLSGEFRTDPASLTDIADESIARLGRTSERASLARRTEVGTAGNPGLTQLVNISDRAGGELIQCQVYLDMHDTRDASRRAVLQLALTASAGQLDDVLGDFQRFVASVRAEGSGRTSDV